MPCSEGLQDSMDLRSKPLWLKDAWLAVSPIRQLSCFLSNDSTFGLLWNLLNPTKINQVTLNEKLSKDSLIWLVFLEFQQRPDLWPCCGPRGNAVSSKRVSEVIKAIDCSVCIVSPHFVHLILVQRRGSSDSIIDSHRGYSFIYCNRDNKTDWIKIHSCFGWVKEDTFRTTKCVTWKTVLQKRKKKHFWQGKLI